MHKCQGFGQLLALPGSFSVKYQLVDTTIPGQDQKDETDLVDGLDLSLPGLARFAGATPPAEPGGWSSADCRRGRRRDIAALRAAWERHRRRRARARACRDTRSSVPSCRSSG